VRINRWNERVRVVAHRAVISQGRGTSCQADNIVIGFPIDERPWITSGRPSDGVAVGRALHERADADIQSSRAASGVVPVDLEIDKLPLCSVECAPRSYVVPAVIHT